MQKTSYALFGSEGFLGEYIYKELVCRNLNVVPVNRIKWEEIKKMNIFKWFSENNISEIIFAAGYNSRFTPEFIDNLEELEIIFKLINLKNVKFTYLSSVLVYGINDSDSVNNKFEEKKKCKPTGAYGMYKRIIEKLILSTSKYHCVLRLVSCIGKKKKTGLLKSIEEQLQDEKCTIKMLHANTTRDYLWVGNAAKMIIEIITSQNSHGIFNVGSGKGIEAIDFINKIADSEKKYIKNIEFGNPMREDPNYLVMNMGKTKKLIGTEKFERIANEDQIFKYINENI